MAITTTLDTYDRTQLEAGGTINEALMQQIFDLSQIPLPFTMRATTMVTRWGWCIVTCRRKTCS